MVKAMILVGSVSLMMTRESAKMCSEADLHSFSKVAGQRHEGVTYSGYSSGENSPARKAHNPDKVFRIDDRSPPELISLSDICESCETA